MSDLWKERFPAAIDHARVRLMKMYGQHYWKFLDHEHLEKIWPKSCHKIENVHTKEQLNDLIIKGMDE